MSDDDDVILVKKSKNIHYGSLEEQEKARLAALAAAARGEVEDNGGQELGDIQISNGKLFVLLHKHSKNIPNSYAIRLENSHSFTLSQKEKEITQIIRSWSV